MIEAVLGVQATFDGLRVRRDLPEGWDGFEITRHYRGSEYRINVHRASAGEQPGIIVDGKAHDGDVLPISEAGSTVQVEVKV